MEIRRSTRVVSSATRCRLIMPSARASRSLTVNGLPEGAASESTYELRSLIASARDSWLNAQSRCTRAVRAWFHVPAIPATAAKTATAASVTDVRFRLTSLAVRYAKVSGRASIGSWLRYRLFFHDTATTEM